MACCLCTSCLFFPLPPSPSRTPSIDNQYIMPLTHTHTHMDTHTRWRGKEGYNAKDMHNTYSKRKGKKKRIQDQTNTPPPTTHAHVLFFLFVDKYTLLSFLSFLLSWRFSIYILSHTNTQTHIHAHTDPAPPPFFSSSSFL